MSEERCRPPGIRIESRRAGAIQTARAVRWSSGRARAEAPGAATDRSWPRVRSRPRERATEAHPARGKGAQARADATPEIDNVRSPERGRQALEEHGDLVLHVSKRLPMAGRAWPPHSTVHRAVAAALPERDERGCVAIVVPPDLPGIKSTHQPVPTHEASSRAYTSPGRRCAAVVSSATQSSSPVIHRSSASRYDSPQDQL